MTIDPLHAEDKYEFSWPCVGIQSPRSLFDGTNFFMGLLTLRCAIPTTPSPGVYFGETVSFVLETWSANEPFSHPRNLTLNWRNMRGGPHTQRLNGWNVMVQRLNITGILDWEVFRWYPGFGELMVASHDSCDDRWQLELEAARIGKRDFRQLPRHDI
jgi:hypothetical protein